MGTHHTIMLGSFVRENPLFAAIVGTVLLALVVLLAGAFVSNLVDRRRQASVRHEPVFDEGRHVDWSRAEPSGAERSVGTAPATASPRSGFGYGAVSVAFLAGLVAGGAGIAVSSQSVATAVASLVELVEPGRAAGGDGLQASGGVAGDSPGSIEPHPGDFPPVEIATRAEVSAKLAVFADRLRASLPRAAGPELSLTRVDLDGMKLSLRYAVGRVMAEDETKAFDAYIMRTVKSLFCGRESREIRFLNENGVVFNMKYTDPEGRTVSKLTVGPGFCT